MFGSRSERRLQRASLPGRRARLPTTLAVRVVRDLLFAAGAMSVANVCGLHLSMVRGRSMEPCLHEGDRLVIERVANDFADVRRGDVTVLRHPRDPGVDCVKRLVGLPGDRIELRGGCLLVNGAVADDHGCIADHDDLAEVVVPAGHCFVLGDNRPESCDSRQFGLVPADSVKGRVRARVWPIDLFAMF